MKGSVAVSVASACLLQIAAATGPKGCCRSNQCLKAIGSPLNGGVADCSANLVVTVTASPLSDVTTTTTTATQTGVETARFTETVTQTASTETLSFSTGTTVTAATQTNTVTETVTVPATATSVQTAPAATSTAWQYIYPLKARLATITTPLAPVLAPAAALPTYAASACSGSWDVYTSACRCAGVEPTTITVLAGGAAPTTVTVTASASVVGSTLSQSETQTASVTATTEVTLTTTVTETPTPATATESATQCQRPGIVFQASSPDPSGTTRYMSPFIYGTFMSINFGYDAPTGWLLDSQGHLQQALTLAPIEPLAAYVKTDVVGSVQVLLGYRSAVDSMVAAGTAARVQGCMDYHSNALFFRDLKDARSNLLLCENALYLSQGNGSDIMNGMDCRPMTITTQ
ncbi:hypothetical protein PG991_014286 [Apiospora marii]|uniref:Uncharacterized protein n=1 Tax=Apiospora marii TaxID=335849 RepID=A0ABR1R8E5_9PEZI